MDGPCKSPRTARGDWSTIGEDVCRVDHLPALIPMSVYGSNAMDRVTRGA